MSVASDEDLRASAPLLEPLLQLAGSPSLKWTTTFNCDGYIVSEIPSAPALDIPLKCFRTQFTVHADVATMAHAIVSQDAVRACDPTLKEIRILGTDHCNALVYTSYISPMPSLVSPRDFCVTSSTLLTTPEQLRRVFPQIPATLFPDYLINLSDQQEESSSTYPGNTVFLQNSRSTASPLVPTTTEEGSITYVRGFVYCYGYLAWRDGNERGKLHVTNFCCADACGRIPKWVVSAAVDQNTQKMKRIAHLVEEKARDQKAKASPVRPPLSSGEEESKSLPEEHEQEDEGQQVSQPVHPLLVSPLSQHTNDVSGRNRPRCRTSQNEAQEIPPDAFNTDAPAQREFLEDATLLGVQTLDATMPALTETLSATPQRNSSLPSPSLSGTQPANTVLSSAVPPNTASSPTPTQQQRQLPETQETQFQSMMQPLALMARSHGWHALREFDNIEHAELRSLPPSLESKGDLCVALRVSTSVNCSLDTIEEVMRSPALASEIDPELVRLVTVPSPSPSQRYNSRQSSASRGDTSEVDTRTPIINHFTDLATTSSSSPTFKAPWKLRHLQFNAQPPFTYPWDMLLRCTDGELSPHEGGRLGFHTAGIAASTYVFVGSSNAGSFSSGADPCVCNAGCGPCTHGFLRVHLHVFGVVAVAIPRSASTVRVTHYLLFDTSSSSSSPSSSGSVRRNDSQFAVKGRKKMAADFLNAMSSWMGQRMCRLRGLCEAQQLKRAQDALVALDKEPLLRYLYNIHCSLPETNAHVTPRCVGNVQVRHTELPLGNAQDRSPPGPSHLDESNCAALPPLYVFSLLFPCSLRHLRAYMRGTSTHARYTMNEQIALYEERASPPGFSTIHVEVCSSERHHLPPTSFSFLETFGILRGQDIPHPALVLSRLNCDHLQCAAGGDKTGGKDGASHFTSIDGVEDALRRGRIYCSGWVATSLDPNDDGDADIDDRPFSAPCSNPFLASVRNKRQIVQQLVARGQKRFGDSQNVKGDAKAAQACCAAGTSGVLVTQYICVGLCTSRGLDSTGSEGLSSSMVEREANLLQRFCDAVCAWKSV